MPDGLLAQFPNIERLMSRLPEELGHHPTWVPFSRGETQNLAPRCGRAFKADHQHPFPEESGFA